MYRYYTSGVCAKFILLDIEGDTICDVVFEGGCEGALIAIKNLVRGKNIDYVIDMLEQVPCKMRGTSLSLIHISMISTIKRNYFISTRIGLW